ncbi:hypothetical protein AMS68_005986 [Peltaster fructicola]|uniref:Uncharacterized protein n=1 Tax=Peltaster fructicola TaxID=286661 RepID=A0A6H0Y0S5_9PEZI|nr:hypothetical protein AMS68_005986 [Peltaster fructicola]
MSRQEVVKHYARLLRSWPVDRLRQEPQTFQHLLKSRIASAPKGDHAEQSEINAAYILLDNRLKNQFSLSKQLMEPQSNPAYYTNLAKELQEIPDRSFFGNLVRRLQNMVRWK